jgi:GAF domain-containing protein
MRLKVLPVDDSGPVVIKNAHIPATEHPRHGSAVGGVPLSDGRPFIDKITQDTRDYVQSLLDEVRRLSHCVSALDVELSTRGKMESLLKEHVAAIEAESRKFAARYVEVEQQSSNLANLYVASYQLHGTLDRLRIVEAIKEIVINLIGSEELLVWERDGDLLRCVGSFGVNEGEWDVVPFGEGIIGLCAETGERFIAGQTMLAPDGREEALTACIPLKLDGRVVGAIAVFRLLPQKAGLAPVDHELFDLLASHAASALYSTRSLTEVRETSALPDRRPGLGDRQEPADSAPAACRRPNSQLTTTN